MDPARADRRRALIVFTVVAAAALAADIVTKLIALAHLREDDPVRLFGGAVYLSLTRNAGAAFSLGGRYTFVFPIIAAVVIVGIGWLLRRLASVPWAIAMGLILGGVLGNLVDRLFRAPGPMRGHVIDFISVFDDAGRVWPIFNLADSCLVVGVILAVLLELTGRQRDGHRVRAGAASDTAGS